MARGLLSAAAVGAGAIALARRRAAAAPTGIDTTDLAGKTAVITGGGSGIGRSLALQLVERGATVHVADRDADRAEQVAKEIDAAGGTAHAHTVDVADPDAVSALADTVFATGPVHLLFNNAGIGHGGAVADTTLEDWRRLVDVNLMGVVHGVHAFLPRLLAQDGPAHIVNTASMAGLVPVPGMTPYSTTKSAVVGMSDALDMELRGTGVRVSALCPGVINTDIVRTATMRGEWQGRQARAVEMYKSKGTSPDVVARQALEAVTRGRRVIPTPRYQVVPHWLLKRLAPPAARGLTHATVRYLARAD